MPLLLACANLPVLGATDTLNHTPPKRNYFGSYLSDAGYLYSTPVRWKGKDWLTLGLISGIGAGIYVFDDDIQWWTIRNKTANSNKFSSIAEKFGNTSYTSLTLGASFLTGLMSNNRKMQKVSLLALKSSLLSGVLAQTIKNIGHRSRPNANMGKDSWHGPKIGGSHKAFPSGHTTAAFALATTFARVYSDKKWVGITAYSLAGLAGLSRIHDNKHWGTDVFAGGLLGYFSALAILRNEERNLRKISIGTSYFMDTQGMTIVIPLF